MIMARSRTHMRTTSEAKNRIGLPPDWQVIRRTTPLSEVIDWSHGFLHLAPDWYSIDVSDQKVAVLDTGCDITHPDLNITSGRDFTGSPSGYADLQDHGTWCAGAIGAVANDTGVRGIAAGCQVFPGKVLNDHGYGDDDTILAGIKWADTDIDVDGISMSLGGSAMSLRVHAALLAFLQRRPGRFVVAAAGNDGPRRPINYPAAWTDVTISVAALKKNGKLTSFSCWGPTVTCSAPGQDMLSTIPGGYGTMSGTSMATPLVAGILLKIRAKHQLVGGATPVDTLEQYKEHIIKYAKGAYRQINPIGMSEEARTVAGRTRLWQLKLFQFVLEIWRDGPSK